MMGIVSRLAPGGLERIGVPSDQDRHLGIIESNSDWVAHTWDLSNSMAAW
jgi:hypothetical protein